MAIPMMPVIKVVVMTTSLSVMSARHFLRRQAECGDGFCL
jgi:hypothetical protein